MANDTKVEAQIVELNEVEGEALFNKIVQRAMGMSGDEFLERWDAGEWAHADYDEVPGLIEARNALPFVR